MKWYVFDLYDCFGSFDTVEEAANLAKALSCTEEGIHIAYMDEETFNKYTHTGRFPFTDY